MITNTQQPIMGNFGAYQQPQFNAYQQPYGGFQQQQPQVKINNILTPEQIKKLKNNADQFTLSLTDEDLEKAWCLHFDENGQKALVYNSETDTFTCSVCGSSFTPINMDAGLEDLKSAIQCVLNMIQSIKCYSPNLIPVEAAKKFYTLIPLLEKVPKLLTTSIDYAVKSDSNNNNNNYYYNNGMGTTAQFQNLAGLFGGGMVGGYQQPSYGYNAQNPNPASFGYAGTATPAGANPFGQPGGPVPQQGYPQPNQGYAFNPDPAAANQPVQTSVQAPVPTQPAAVDVSAAPVADAGTTTVKEEVKL